MRQAINQIKFLSVSRDVKAAVKVDAYDSISIAAKHHVSRQTVYAIKRAKTWPGYVLAKQHINTMRARAKADKFDANRASAIKTHGAVHTREDRFADKLEAITGPVGRNEHNQLHNSVRGLRLRIEALENAQPRRGWFSRSQ